MQCPKRISGTDYCPSSNKSSRLVLFTNKAATLIFAPPGHPIVLIEIYSFVVIMQHYLNQSSIMGCPGRKINMAAVSVKMVYLPALEVRFASNKDF